jgi:hypothetical protein
MSWITRIGPFLKLASIPTEYKQLHSTPQSPNTSGKTTRFACQPGQIVPEFRIIRFHRVGFLFTHKLMSTWIVNQGAVRVEFITEIRLGLRAAV